MKNLLFKDFFLLIPKTFYVFLLTAATIIAPGFLCMASIVYVLVPVTNLISAAGASRDAEFTASLPVSRDRIVNARIMTIVLLELMQTAAAAAFAPLAAAFSPAGNTVGLDPNPTLFGAALFSLGLFDLAYFPLFYRTGTKSGFAGLMGLLAFAAGYALVETAVRFIPGWAAVLDTLAPSAMGIQSVVLTLGAALFVGSVLLSALLSRHNYRKAVL